MMRTLPLAPGQANALKAQQTGGTAKPPPFKTSPHKVAPTQPHHRPPRSGPAHSFMLAGILALAVIAAAGLWWLAGDDEPEVDPSVQLQAQMEAAARGEVVPTHAFGGALSVVQANGRINVVAEGVPSRACVQVGWRLARAGTIIVNGTLPPRLSAAKLSELCSGDGASLLWVPYQAPDQ